MKIVHLETTIQTIFGLVDEDGDVIKKQPVTLSLSKLNKDSFEKSLESLQDAKNQLIEGNPD